MKTQILCTIALLSMLNMFAADFLMNSDWTQKTPAGTPANWELIGNPNNLKAADGVLTIVDPSGSKTILLQSLKNVNQGQTYELTYEVKAAVGNEYFVYLENKIDKSYGPATGKCFFGNGQWTKRCITFIIPEHSKNTRLVLRLMNASTVEFRNINIASSTEMKPAAEATVNYLNNTSFEDLNSKGLPLNWEILGEPKTVSFDGNVVSVTKFEEGLAILCQAMKLVPKTHYLLSYEVNAPIGSNCFVYLENKVDKTYGPATGKIFSGIGKWERREIPFSPPNFTEKTRLIVRVMSPGTAQFRNFIITETVQSHGNFEFEYSKDEKQTLFNGNFENGSSNWDMHHNSGVTRAYDDYGNYSLKMEAQGVAKQHAICFIGGQKYRLNYYAKAMQNKPQKFQIKIEFPDGVAFEKNCVAETDSYQRYEITFTAPTNAPKVLGNVICKLDDDQSILMDEFFLSEITPEEQLPVRMVVTSPYNGKWIFSTDPIDNIEGTYDSDKHITSVQISLAQDGKIIYDSGKKAASGSFSIPAKELAIADYTLTLTPYDGNGKVLPALSHKIDKLPPAKYEVTYRKDNNFYINGKIFIPFTLLFSYDSKRSSLSTYTAQKNGINSVFIEEGSILASLNKLHENNLKRFVSINHMTGLSKDQWRLPIAEFAKLFQKRLKEVLTPEIMNHPALLGYDIYDEVWGNNLPLKNYLLACKMVREMDPYHPQILTEAPRSVIPEYLSKFAAEVDALGTDLYPVPVPTNHSSLADKDLTGTGAYMKIMSEAVKGRKPVFIWLQAFNWKDIGSAKGRLPNIIENRFTNFDAMMNDASMLIYYNDNCKDTDYYQNVLYPTVKEITSFAGVFRLGKDIEGIKVNDPVAVTAKLYNGESYLILANRSNKNCTATISGIEHNGNLYRLDKQSEITVVDGKLTTAMTPFEVQIFSTSSVYPEGLDPMPARNEQYEAQQNDLFYPYFHQYPELENASWIWFPGESKQGDSVITAYRDFTIKGEVKKAVIYITADNQHTTMVNGVKVDENRNWKQIVPINITKHLNQGNNRLEINAANSGGWAGILAGVDIFYANGEKEHFGSDEQWTTRNKAGAVLNAETQKLGIQPWAMDFEIEEENTKE